MNNKLKKSIIITVTSLSLSSTILGSASSIYASDIKSTTNTETVSKYIVHKDMSKYSTKNYDPITNSTTISVSSDQFVKYLIDSGVKSEDIPSELKARTSFKIFHLKFYGRKSHGNANLYVTTRGMRLYHGSAMAGHFYLMILDLYGYRYWKAAKDFALSVKDVVEAASTHHGRVFYMRHWHYRGNHRWH